ncbi:hypothetical protein BO221_04740 [Archangium sp. Cb G35]|uniref:hypothetical protein n=1 Tax=Archangium sp. Cb G35 TaxID=1920190 RepID=UPI000937E661|nr:hypothetical protein [Archangium sp. Cb G35]OJT27295.1 hypothetical protein BO221_04740 [Archangium sp. Cb G35]
MSNGAGAAGAGTDIDQLDAPPPVSAELRAKILADPNIAKMAAELEMELDEFVNTVGYYMNNPGVEPAFLVVSDENLRKMGVEPPTSEAIEASVRASVEAFKAGQAPSGFDDARKKGVDLSAQGGEAVKIKADPGLEDAIKKGRTPSKP